MLRAGANNLLRRLNVHEAKCGQTDFSLEFVRWRRKPRWLPVAKSKLFRVPERKQQDADEKAELLRLNNNYRTQMRSLRLFLREEVKRHEEISSADHIVLTPEQEEAEYQRCLAENEKWNQEIAAARNARLELERKNQAAYIKERLEEAAIREEERLARIEAIVKREKELLPTFITRENLDAAIEHALANPIDYNFAIDLQGRLYQGRENNTKPTTSNDSAAGGDGEGVGGDGGIDGAALKQIFASN